MGAGESKEAGSQPQLQNEVKPQSPSCIDHGEPHASVAMAEPKLPHLFEEILKESDTIVDKSSAEKLYNQLYTGVFLNGKTKRYWVNKKSNSNCFMVYARGLLITWADDPRFWQWPTLDGSSDEGTIPAAELLNVCWLEVHGRFQTAKLSPEVTYEVVFIVKLKDPAYGWETPVNLRLILPNGSRQERKENLFEKRRGQWIEIPVGEFTTSPENAGEMEFSLYEYEGGKWKRGLVIKGVSIRQKC